jgi:AcrR family transcriptional regulator
MVLDEQMRSTKRGYRKTKRAEDEQRTRRRIVDAAESLHATVGPARTSVSAVAARAGVTRATVYRHFPDDEALFTACSAQWVSHQRLPEPEAWTALPDPMERLRAGLTDIYRYYRSGEQMLTLIHRDADAVPAPVREKRIEAQHRWARTLLQPFPRGGSTKVRAAVRHAAGFDTWRSLCVVQGLSDRTAVELMVGMVAVAQGQLRAQHRPR